MFWPKPLLSYFLEQTSTFLAASSHSFGRSWSSWGGEGAKVGSGCLWQRRALAIDSHGPMAKWCRGLLERASRDHGAETGFRGSPLILQSTLSIPK